MVRKKWIVIVCCIAAAAVLCTVTYAEKSEKCSLPAVVQAAVKAFFPTAIIEENGMEKESVKMYEVKVKDGNKESDVKLAEDGIVVEVESVEDINALPAAVAKTFKAQDAKLSKVEKAVEYAQLKVVKLDTPIVTYEAKITKGGKETEIKVAADGTILKQETEKKKDKDEEREEHEKGKDKD